MSEIVIFFYIWILCSDIKSCYPLTRNFSQIIIIKMRRNQNLNQKIRHPKINIIFLKNINRCIYMNKFINLIYFVDRTLNSFFIFICHRFFVNLLKFFKPKKILSILSDELFQLKLKFIFLKNTLRNIFCVEGKFLGK